MDGHWDVFAANGVAVSLFGNWMAEAGNMLRFVFLDAAAKRLIDNWPDRAKRLLAEFRLDYGRRFPDSPMPALVRELQGSRQEFSLWWGEHQVREREGGLRDRKGGLWGKSEAV